ncbi:MAG: M48 family metallopeptidase [Nitrospirae bacterium]|nr:M48 family metallopeptidase [Nitrospirota bacterium]
MTTPLLIVFAAYVVTEGFGYYLEYLNIRHLMANGTLVPEEFKGSVDGELLKKTSEYQIDNTRFGVVASIFDNVVAAVFIFGGFLSLYNSWILSFKISFVYTGLVFFLLLNYGQTILSMPFSLYRTFKIEKKYGFNTTTLRVWITDTVKSMALSTILMGALFAAGLYLIERSPDFWWLWVWGVFFAFTIILMYVSPYIIEPLFNKFTPIDDEAIVLQMQEMMGRVGITVKSIFKMDASRRSTHTNAYFTGIGRVKRIILYDTLLEKLDTDELLGIVAHEAGHWRKRHLLKLIAAYEIVTLIVLYVFFIVLKTDIVLRVFNIGEDSFFVKVLLLSFIAGIVAFPLRPLSNAISRRHEREADRFAVELTGRPDNMITALVKLSKDNLSNLHPHPLYVLFHYSHPPAVERIKYLKESATL